MRMPRPWWRAMVGTRDVASCLHVARVLQAHLDGQVDDRTARRVAQHLEICRRCGLEAATYTDIKRALAGRRIPLRAGTVDRLRDFASQLME